MTDRTLIVFDSDIQHVDLKKKALDCQMTLSELLTKGAICYRPKKGNIQGMDEWLDICDIPEDFYNKKQWNKHISKLKNSRKLKEQVLWLASRLKI